MNELSLNNCRLDDRYDVREVLGRGSYAEIFLARDTLASPHSPHGQVVIKALNVFLQDDLDADLERTLVENFQNEATALDRVRHPKVISRIGHGTARDLRGTVFHFIVLEYMPGGDLSGLIRKSPVPLATAFALIEQVCAGLAHAHSRGIIHRDIKPQNLLLSRDHSIVKIADFGVARVEISDSPITRVGTNIYAPPEHSPLSVGRTGALDFGRITPAADIYSLAKSVYTILTGEAPRAFANEPIDVIPEPLRAEPWADELVRTLEKATQTNPAERYLTVAEFWSDLSPIGRRSVNGGTTKSLLTTETNLLSHNDSGYTPQALAIPAFRSTSERPTVNPAPAADRVPLTPDAAGPVLKPADTGINNAQATLPKSRGAFLSRAAVFILLAGLFAGILYGTATMMRGGSVAGIFAAFGSQTGVAVTDIYLRSGPDADNESIGLVTKNSKVRIVKSQNNWYQVDIIQQGTAKPPQTNATRGWLNGRYIEVSKN